MAYRISYRDENSIFEGTHTLEVNGTREEAEEIVGELIHNGCYAVSVERA